MTAALTDFLPVLDAQRTQLSIQAQLAQSETRTATSLVAIYKALGGGWEIENPPTKPHRVRALTATTTFVLWNGLTPPARLAASGQDECERKPVRPRPRSATERAAGGKANSYHPSAMKKTLQVVSMSCLFSGSASASQPALTIYNQDFAVVRDTVPLNLKAGVNQVSFAGATAFLEPSSVVLRDPAGKEQLRILEQNYRADTVSQEMLLTLNEGKTIQFEVMNQAGGQTKRELISGKIIRSGSGVPPGTMASYGPVMGYGEAQPIIEVDGKLRFSLPGQPIFPALADDTILKPTLFWVVEAEHPARFDAELSYITGGLSWEADYNLVMPERGDTVGHGRLGHDGQPKRQLLQAGPDRTHGRGCKQDSERRRFSPTSRDWAEALEVAVALLR